GDVLLGEINEGVSNTSSDGSTKPSRTYLFEPFSFKPLALVQHGHVYHYHTDHIGTPREITNAKAEVVWSSTFKTYGAPALAHVNEVDNPLRFQGQYYDEETGLHYNRHRYYDPNSGQFTTQDPIGLLGGMNAYQYAPNPMTWVDPWGLSCKDGQIGLSKSDQARIAVIPKGSRPDPSSYLSESYIKAHLQQFDDGATRFMTESNLSKYGVGQRDGTAFVMTKGEADKLLEAAGGNARQMESALGLPHGFLEGNNLVRVDIPSPRELGLRIPSGNEAGANPLWIPGGKLPNGALEGVINVTGAPAGNFVKTPISF
ncbi:MAG: RHS repeat domain-containing protein, partial [Limnobacter sp.]|uniref:RHS repeat domain-containing protein n=1 Tax=Limnobacter sp. TaxID=2003368 RepID=UPI004037E1DB